GRGGLPRRLAELPVELANAGLARVLADDQLERDVVDRHLVLAQPGPFTLARPQIATGDRDLLVDRVAVEADYFHPVEQRAGDGLRDVCRRDEDDLGKIELDVEV